MKYGVRSVGTISVSLAMLTWSGSAFGYRPFDGTDAAVAARRFMEIELGPAQYAEMGDERTLFAPDVVLNFGIADRWELVLEGALAKSLLPDSGPASLVGNALFLKGVLREGSLQDKAGPSIATEFGFLLPDINSDMPGSTGASLTGIVSQRWPALTVHFNAGVALTRQQNADVAFSAIVEGPYEWPIRPVAELFYEREFGGSETGSALVGAIWRVRDEVSFDVGFRSGWIDGQPLREVRAGVTFGFDLFSGGR